MVQLLDTVLLLALPASGKSEVRHYLAQLSEAQCQNDFHMGQTLQLDDYPYVHFMHRIDDELHARGLPYIFYKGPNRPFIDDFTWGVLIHLLNEDYDNLLNNRTVNPPSAAQHLFDRLDAARVKVDLHPAIGDIPYRKRCEIADVMEAEVLEHQNELNEAFAQDRTGKTIVIEAARGGVNGSAFPLTPPHGYGYSIGQFSTEILDRASILYVWVTPEESRRKNIERGRPDGQGSILHHSVPMEVMLGQYACDDMEFLISKSDVPDTVRIERIVPTENRYELKTWHLRVGRFDNRNDLTSFLRKERADWGVEETAALHNGLKSAFDKLVR